jgi:hypothetical protein
MHLVTAERGGMRKIGFEEDVIDTDFADEVSELIRRMSRENLPVGAGPLALKTPTLRRMRRSNSTGNIRPLRQKRMQYKHPHSAWYKISARSASMRKSLKIFLMLAVASITLALGSMNAPAQEFVVCKATFALCTVAPCYPISGSQDKVACHCTVNRGYSVGEQPCQATKDTPEGQQIRSRYYPVRSYAICSNDRPWAWCLDKPCTIDKNNPEAALCVCDAVKNLGDYVIVTDKYAPDTCTTGIISSATVKQITQVTEYLKNRSKKLRPFKIQVLNK